MEQVAILVALAFAANKLVTVLKALTSKDWNMAITQFVVWLVAFGVVLLAAEAEVTEGVIIPGMSEALGSLGLASLVLLGFIVGSTGSVVFDFRKAFDASDSAAEPSLLDTTPPPD